MVVIEVTGDDFDALYHLHMAIDGADSASEDLSPIQEFCHKIFEEAGKENEFATFTNLMEGHESKPLTLELEDQVVHVLGKTVDDLLNSAEGRCELDTLPNEGEAESPGWVDDLQRCVERWNEKKNPGVSVRNWL